MRTVWMRALGSILLAFSVLYAWDEVWAKEVFLEARRSDFQKIPIWVLGFEDGESSPEDLASLGPQAFEVLKADLQRSLVFTVQDFPTQGVGLTSNRCESPSAASEAKVNGIAVLTWGKVQRKLVESKGMGLVVDACAYDSGSEDVLPGKRYAGGPATSRLLRLMVHRWADELVYRYTGEQGIARTKIAFVSEESGSRELFVMDYDGFGPQQVTADGFLNLMPAWSPDRKLLVYTAYHKQNQAIVRHVLSSGTRETLVAPESLNITPAISPDGKFLAYASAHEGNSEIYKLDLETKEVVQLSFDSGADLSPTWSPDGRQISFTSDRGGRPQIYIMKADGSNTHRLTFKGDYNAAPTWSPKGNWIAYVCRVPQQDFKLCRMTADGQHQAQVTSGRGIDDSPSWSPDGRHLVFSSTREGKSHIYLIHADGTGLERLTSGGTHHSSPAWSPY